MRENRIKKTEQIIEKRISKNSCIKEMKNSKEIQTGTGSKWNLQGSENLKNKKKQE